MERVHSAETAIEQTATSITSLASMNDTYIQPDGTTATNTMKSYVNQTAEGITQNVSSTYATKTELSDGYVNKNELDTRVFDEDSWLYRKVGGSKDISDGVARVQSIKGNTVVWNQLNNNSASTNTTGLTRTFNADGSITLNGTSTAGTIYLRNGIPIKQGHKYLIEGCPSGGGVGRYGIGFGGNLTDTGAGGIWTASSDLTTNLQMPIGANMTFDNVTFFVNAFDLTLAYGAGNEPTTVEQFKQQYPEDYYAYTPAPALLSSHIAGIQSASACEFPAQTLRGAGSAHDVMTRTGI